MKAKRKPNYERLAVLAAAQDNVVTRMDALALGFTDARIQLLLRRKLWLQLQRGVYLVGPGPASWRQKARAAQWAGGTRIAVDAGSALLLWGVEGPDEGRIALTTTSAKGHPAPRDAVLRQPTRSVSVRVRDGIRVVCIEDALLSFAALSKDRRAVEIAVESALLSKRTTERKIWRTVAVNARPGVRGIALLRDVMERRPNGKPSRSILELEVLDLLRSSGLPLPTRNVDVVDGNGENREIDLCYLDVLGAIEADSKRWHSTETQLAEDARRQTALEAVGFRFVRVTWTDVFQRPDWVIGQVRELLNGVVAA